MNNSIDPVGIELIERYPRLQDSLPDVLAAFELLSTCYGQDGIVYICGNGGSAADAEHIVGELMKSFAIRRPLTPQCQQQLEGVIDCKNLEGALRAVSLCGHPSLATAFANDVAPEMIFAQQILGYGRVGDVLWGISTSGNSHNVIQALKVARARGLKTLGLTGTSGGAMREFCDVCIRVPEKETFKIQELHLPIYHALCRMLENRFFA